MTLVAAVLVVAAVAASSQSSRRRLVRREPRRPVAPGGAGDVPLAVDLLAACLGAGASIATALRAAASAAPDAAATLAAVASALDRGADPREAWAPAADDPRLADVARVGARAGTTGAAVADELRRIATRMRAARATDAQRRVQRASVWIVLPLGLCFLPAFVLVGIVPLVVSAVPRLLR